MGLWSKGGQWGGGVTVEKVHNGCIFWFTGLGQTSVAVEKIFTSGENFFLPPQPPPHVAPWRYTHFALPPPSNETCCDNT